MNKKEKEKILSDAWQEVISKCSMGDHLTHHGGWLVSLIWEIQDGGTPELSVKQHGSEVPNSISQFINWV